MKEFKFNGYNGISLHGRIWFAEDASATLLIVHGFGEHSGRYADFASYLNGRGFNVMAFDNRGHGLSEGRRGVILNWKEYRQDIFAAFERMGQEFPLLPAFLMGHSLGGTMVLDYALEYPGDFRGVISSAPALGAPGISPLLLAISRVLSRITPRLALNAGLETDALSRDKKIVEDYISDPLVHGKGSARLSSELTRIQQRIFEKAASFSCPLLLSYGSDDRIAPREPIERFYHEAGIKDKEFQVFEGSFHEIHNDLDKDDVYRLYSEWMLARI